MANWLLVYFFMVWILCAILLFVWHMDLFIREVPVILRNEYISTRKAWLERWIILIDGCPPASLDAQLFAF
jgi:hypothetical protein